MFYIFTFCFAAVVSSFDFFQIRFMLANFSVFVCYTCNLCLKYNREELRLRKLPRMQSLCDLARPSRLSWNIPEDVKRQIVDVSNSLDRFVKLLVSLFNYNNNYSSLVILSSSRDTCATIVGVTQF